MSSLVAVLTPGEPPSMGDVEHALAAAPHRGQSNMTVARGSCALGVAVHEGRPDGGMAYDDEFALVFAGVVDNIGDLAALLDEGPQLASGPPPSAAVLLAGFRMFGERLPTLMRGAYTVAVTDGNRLWCFRDHLGLGTLFSRHEARRHWAASEAKQIVAASRIRREPDLDVLETVFYGGENDATGAFLAGVKRVPKSTLLEADDGIVRTSRYWEPERLLETARIPKAELQPRFEFVMSQAVERVLRGDEILALSGGIDSPTLAAFASAVHLERFGRPLPAFSMVFPNYPTVDERTYIEEVANCLGMPVHAYEPDPADHSLARLGEWVALFDGPWSGAWEPGMDDARYQRIRRLGYKTLLTGEFAEYVMDFRRHIVIHLLTHGRLRALARQLRMQRRRGISSVAIARQLAGSVIPGRMLRVYRRYRPRFPATDWVDRDRIVRAVTPEVVSPRQRWRRQQLGAFIGPGIPLEAYQTFQEVAGVRVRNPWGDVDVWEYFLSLPAEQKFPGMQTKHLVRHFMRGRLPDRVLDRRDKTVLDEFVKAGFDYVSLRRWLGKTDYRMPGVDYGVLRRHLEKEDLSIFGYLWAKDLAGIHAFLSLW